MSGNMLILNSYKMVCPKDVTVTQQGPTGLMTTAVVLFMSDFMN
jgi:hypothetical protein